MERTTPEKLFVCEYKVSQSPAQALKRFFTQGTPLPAELHTIRVKHLQYIAEISKKGILWLGGPFTDWTGGIDIYAVDSLEEAKKIQENEPYYANGVFYDAKYSEWAIHSPLGMAAPAHRERLEQGYRALGLL